MQITKEQINKALDLIDKWRETEDKLAEAFVTFFNALCPAQHRPVVELQNLPAVLDTLNTMYPEHKEDWSYYAWELPGMDSPVEVTFNGKTYNAKNRDEYVQFIVDCDNYPN
jgi:hypothetical protein|tara:strand:- start:305 stop:640 length:336 start_codon:yes stop_codon:yes gene_type:complete